MLFHQHFFSRTDFIPPEQREVNLLVESSWWLKSCFAGMGLPVGFSRPLKLLCAHETPTHHTEPPFQVAIISPRTAPRQASKAPGHRSLGVPTKSVHEFPTSQHTGGVPKLRRPNESYKEHTVSLSPTPWNDLFYSCGISQDMATSQRLGQRCSRGISEAC